MEIRNSFLVTIITKIMKKEVYNLSEFERETGLKPATLSLEG